MEFDASFLRLFVRKRSRDRFMDFKNVLKFFNLFSLVLKVTRIRILFVSILFINIFRLIAFNKWQNHD